MTLNQLKYVIAISKENSLNEAAKNYTYHSLA